MFMICFTLALLRQLAKNEQISPNYDFADECMGLMNMAFINEPLCTLTLLRSPTEVDGRKTICNLFVSELFTS